MEKIYMENNNDDKERLNFKDFFRRNGIVITSVLIIIVAVAAFITGGFSQTSYAIPEVTNALPDKFKTVNPTVSIIGGNGDATNNVVVEQYFTDGGVQVFCLERNINFVANVEYSKGESIGDKDYGLLYLMANSYPNKNFQNDGQDLNEYLQTWITQIAIWDYLYQTGEKNNSAYADILDKVKVATKVYVEAGTDYSAGGKNIYTAYIEPLVKNAIANRKGVHKDLNARTENSEISLTEDEKYYQSSAVIVTGNPADNFNGYKVELAAAPKGTILVDSTGKEIEDLTNFTVGQKFWVRVPVDSVTEDNKIVKLSVTGSFRVYDGNYYIAEGRQTISSVKTVNTNVNTGLDIELNYTPAVPDTGMSTAQTIYFVGLLVLLSGLGIIYANVKPKESR